MRSDRGSFLPARGRLGPRRALALALTALALAFGLVAGSGCGGAIASRPSEDDRPTRLGRALDAAEARLDSERVILDGLDAGACVDRCRSVTSICDASAEICGIARELGDERSRARCARAEDACSSSRDVVTTGGCACETPATSDLPTS